MRQGPNSTAENDGLIASLLDKPIFLSGNCTPCLGKHLRADFNPGAFGKSLEIIVEDTSDMSNEKGRVVPRPLCRLFIHLAHVDGLGY